MGPEGVEGLGELIVQIVFYRNFITKCSSWILFL